MSQAFFVLKAVDKFGNAVAAPSAADGGRGFKSEISGAQVRVQCSAITALACTYCVSVTVCRAYMVDTAGWQTLAVVWS